MNRKEFIDWCQGNMTAVRQAESIIKKYKLNYEKFVASYHYVDGEWEIDAPFNIPKETRSWD